MINTTMSNEAVWVQDGHRIHLELSKSELYVTSVYCPGGECAHSEVGCVVRHFIDNYGLDCNVGTCMPDESIEVAWTLIGRASDIDACQLWFIPVTDYIYSQWASAERATSEA